MDVNKEYIYPKLDSMISVKEAFEAIMNEINPLSTEIVSIQNSLGQVLAEDVLSPINMPPFNQSAMDGYALSGADLTRFEVVCEVQAGDSTHDIKLEHGQAARIFTGAMVPSGTSAIAKQEIVSVDGNVITINESIPENANVRPLGEQIRANEIALKNGSVMNAGAAGYLYTLGLNEIKVYRKPKVCVIATGNELISPGKTLPEGKIYESNTYTLSTALGSIGIDSTILKVEDDYNSTKKILETSIDEFDMVITTGGISVGDYDFVGSALDDLGTESIFYKVKQKPGKPLYFGKKDQTFIFGLPGNPAAVLTCFYMYVIPGIRTMMQNSEPFLEKRRLSLKESYSKSKSLSHFLKASVNDDEVLILNAQSSAMLSSFANSNSIVCLPEGESDWAAGDKVDVYILPS